MSEATNDDRLSEALERLQRLEDTQAVLNLFQDYRRHLDTRDLAAYAKLFTEDGVWSGNLGSATGPAAIEELLVNTLEIHEHPRERHLHLVENPVVEVDGDTATATSNWVYITRDFSDNPVVSMIGSYRDVVVRTDAGWLFKRRDASLDFPYAELVSG